MTYQFKHNKKILNKKVLNNHNSIKTKKGCVTMKKEADKSISKSIQEKKEILAVPYIIKRSVDGYVAECIDLNVVSQGNTIEEARKNIKEAILLHFESASDLGILEEILEKLGVIKKQNKLVVPERELERIEIEVPC